MGRTGRRKGKGGAAGPVSVGVVPRVEPFVGRASLLAALRAGLSVPRQKPIPWVLAGRSGSGTTAVAAEYAHRWAREYEAVVWIDAADALAAARDMAEAALRLELSFFPQHDQTEAASALRDHFEGEGRFLLVFDGARAVVPLR